MLSRTCFKLNGEYFKVNIFYYLEKLFMLCQKHFYTDDFLIINRTISKEDMVKITLNSICSEKRFCIHCY